MTQTNMLRSISSLRRVRIPGSVFTTSSYCSEVSRDVQLDVLKSAVESVVTSKTPDGDLLDLIRSQAAQQSCRVDIASGHFRWFGPAPFRHQLVTLRLAVQVMNSHYTHNTHNIMPRHLCSQVLALVHYQYQPLDSGAVMRAACVRILIMIVLITTL